MRKYVFICIGIVVFSLSFAHEAAACECMVRPGPCGAPTQADVVFVGRVADIVSRNPETILTGLTVRFAIERSFKGLSVTHKTVEVKTGAGGGDCGYDFKPGQRYFVFASLSEGFLYTSICSNTQPASGAEDDIELIDALVRGRPETRIFGRIELLEQKVETSPEDLRSLSLAGMRVEARNTSTVLLGTTDADGLYRIKDVPPGRYVIRLVGPFPPNLELLQRSAQNVEIRPPTGCGARVDFPAYAYGEVRGRILDSSGQPLGSNIDVGLVKEDSFSNGIQAISGTRTGPGGTYEFRYVRAGRYVVGVNLDNPPSAESPYPRTYLSSASGKPAIVSIVRGVTRSNVDIRLPRGLDTISIVGRVVDTQGVPVRGASIEVIDVEYSRRVSGIDADTAGEAAADGSFSITVIRNRSYEVRAYLGKDFTRTGRRPEAPTITTNRAVPPLNVVLSKARK